jgi:ABC-type sugar transport system ATPase subunit
VPVLQARAIEKNFENTVALQNVNFELEEGEVHALLGENGAGKSTLAKILAGVVLPDRGELYLRGSRVEIASPVAAQALGIGMVFQELDLFPHLSVADNLAVGNTAAGERFFVRRKLLNRWSSRFLDQVGLKVDPSTRLGALSVGHRQLVAIARALSMNARIILMDEPTSSLSQANVETLFSVLADLKRDGVSIVYVSHKMEEVQRICDRITVLRDGAHVATENASTKSIDDLIQLMVGRRLGSEPRSARSPGKILLDVRALSTKHISGVRFQLRAGEVLGISGLVGSGRSEIGAALSGTATSRRMDASLSDQPYEPTCVAEAIQRGLCLLPEERKTDSIFPHMTTIHNITISVLKRYRSCGLIEDRLEKNAAESIFRRLNLNIAKSDVSISALSGGNQQKAIMARCLLTNPQVLFLDEPTRGIDVGAKEQIYALFDELAKQGRGIILVSSELPELLRCCDRVLIMHEGLQTGIVSVETTSQQEILTLATGITTPNSPDDRWK